MQKKREKLTARLARRQEKAESPTAQVDDPMRDPSIDWGDAVREVKLPADAVASDEESDEETEEEA